MTLTVNKPTASKAFRKSGRSESQIFVLNLGWCSSVDICSLFVPPVLGEGSQPYVVSDGQVSTLCGRCVCFLYKCSHLQQHIPRSHCQWARHWAVQSVQLWAAWFQISKGSRWSTCQLTLCNLTMSSIVFSDCNFNSCSINVFSIKGLCPARCTKRSSWGVGEGENHTEFSVKTTKLTKKSE